MNNWDVRLPGAETWGPYLEQSPVPPAAFAEDPWEALRSFLPESLPSALHTAASGYAENEIETMVKAKGFADCLCFLQSGRADLTVMTSGDALTAAQVAQIRDIVLSKSSVTAQNITIVEVK